MLYLQLHRILPRGNFTIIPECYSVYLVVFATCTSLGCFEHPRVIVLKVYPIEVFILKLLSCSKLYSDSEYTDTVLPFGFIPLALVVHTCI